LSRWSPRRLQYQRGYTGSSRRTSAPVSLGKKPGFGSTPSPNRNTNDDLRRDYGTTPHSNEQGNTDPVVDDINEDSSLETIISAGWKRGLGLVKRWTGISWPARNRRDSTHSPV
jgi:hypothetical protein